MDLRYSPSQRGDRTRQALTSLAFGLALAATTCLAPVQAAGDTDLLVVKTVKRPYADVRTDLSNAIVNQGLKVDLNGHIGDMLKRTAADIGATGEVYSYAEYFTFCSSKLSRTMMEMDPVNMGLCPYTMFIYERPGGGEVTVGYKSMPMRGNDKSQASLQAINKLLETILKEATE
jgi:uncharacterized protein (DUF302 family)